MNRIPITRCVAAFLVCTALPLSAEQFSFVALGDTAYNGEADKVIYRELIESINESNPAFSIHVGDIWGANLCIRERYEEIRDTFSLFDHPVVYTPGDNEWTDCNRGAYGGFAPHTRLALLREVFYTSSSSQGAKPMKLVRQSEISPYEMYSENSRWIYNGILFFTVHISGSSNNYIFTDATELYEAQKRTEANIAWIRDGFRIARENNLAGVVVAFHAELFRNLRADEAWGTPYAPMVEEFQIAADRYQKPILLIHGDTHDFIVDRPFVSGGSTPLRFGNLMRLEVYGSPETRAVTVTVDTESNHLFGFTPLYNE